MLVMPYNFDQPDNATRVARLGVARVISRRDYTLGRVTRELNALLSNPSYDQRVRELGQEVMRENGARPAVDAIELLI